MDNYYVQWVLQEGSRTIEARQGQTVRTGPSTMVVNWNGMRYDSYAASFFPLSGSTDLAFSEDGTTATGDDFIVGSPKAGVKLSRLSQRGTVSSRARATDRPVSTTSCASSELMEADAAL